MNQSEGAELSPHLRHRPRGYRTAGTAGEAQFTIVSHLTEWNVGK